MDTLNIPKSFWHAVSFCMVIATLGLLIIAYKSTSVSIEIANTKIELKTALSTTKQIRDELLQENERLKQAGALLGSRAEDKTTTAPGGPPPLAASGEPETPQKIGISQDIFDKLDQRIQSAEQALAK